MTAGWHCPICRCRFWLCLCPPRIALGVGAVLGRYAIAQRTTAYAIQSAGADNTSWPLVMGWELVNYIASA
jgi:hypothetical protein